MTGTLAGAISSAGGVALSEIDEVFQLKRWPQVYAVGEMLDWGGANRRLSAPGLLFNCRCGSARLSEAVFGRPGPATIAF